jgi:acyl carrier protein
MINTKEALLHFIATNLGYSTKDIKETDSLEDDLTMDELDRVELTMSLEEEFGIEIPDEDSEKFSTVKDIIDYLISKNITLG